MAVRAHISPDVQWSWINFKSRQQLYILRKTFCRSNRWMQHLVKGLLCCRSYPFGYSSWILHTQKQVALSWTLGTGACWKRMQDISGLSQNMPVYKIEQLPFLEDPCKSSQFHCSSGYLYLAIALLRCLMCLVSFLYLFIWRTKVFWGFFVFVFLLVCTCKQLTVTVYLLFSISCYLINALVSFPLSITATEYSYERLFCCKDRCVWVGREAVVIYLDVCELR